MKKILSNILLVIAVIALILTCAENADGSINVLWTFGWLGVLVLSAIGWQKLNPDKEK